QYQSEFKRLNMLGMFFMIGLFYLNSYLLIPRWLFQKKIITFAAIQLICFAALFGAMNAYLNQIMQHIQLPELPPFHFVHSGAAPFSPEQKRLFILPFPVVVFPFLMTVSASIAYYYVLANIRRENNFKEEKMANLTSELQFLKSQVSPHFLFNILNSMTYLARKQSVILEPALIKLSSLLRYMLYDTDAEKVLLDKEIKYLENYIDLQQIRYHDLSVKVFLNIDDEKKWKIAPMLLIPFVENAFKHAGSFVDDDSFIKIELVTKGQELFFSVWNKYTESKPEQMDNASGIGLKNVQKRLEILYPGHILSIERKHETFMIDLRLNLNN
ncbi:MAG: histidine kinase, partial [Bacteroidota bacterium]